MASDAKYMEIFALNGKSNLLEEQDFGIINGKLALNVPYRDVLSFKKIYAPPFVSSNFLFDVRLFGEKVSTDGYKWYPHKVLRWGKSNDVNILSSLVLAENKRAVILSVTLNNQSKTKKKVPVQFDIQGKLDYYQDWEFAKPESVTGCKDTQKGNRLIKSNKEGTIVIYTDIKGMKWHDYCLHWDGQFEIPARGQKTFNIVVSIGNDRESQKDCDQIAVNIKKEIVKADFACEQKVKDLFNKIPEFTASDKRLEKFYHRSLVHLILNKWDVKEFLLHPYYSTGGINGGCICNYLWDFGEGWELFGMYDPDALKTHLKTFLNNDMTRHFAFSPAKGRAIGPFYQINQEKLIFLIYYYVLLSGDVDFLDEKVKRIPIIDLVMDNAKYGDDFAKPAVLVNYGKGNHLLELRREYIYDYVMPDLNARRYANYQAAAVLCKAAGRDEYEQLLQRTEPLKKLLKQQLWSAKDKWFYFLNAKNQKELRYTIQMFKLIDSDVLDAEQRKGLLSHINEEEFLSDYGMHSMSKKDPAYDQVDIDNGGGGAYTGFPPQVIEKLYKAGYPKIAEDIFKRILWWGERFPYWGDSFVANNIDYRKDSPLQNTIGSISGAQSIIFGMFGIQVTVDGLLTINPVPPSYSPEISLKGLRIRGNNIDISAKGKEYTVAINSKKHKCCIGEKFTSNLQQIKK
ncbi:MAG: hypothetical protein A2Y10_10550 [Planctomycetes bacterium GWF2_41_51]|nr:MAG: hypothetical protein A2Y10_10550 [Planctomycetes bacterium GWF2_41_51]HBG26915.1 hypothetical protein [Phycisphaerales bacterium]